MASGRGASVTTRAAAVVTAAVAVALACHATSAVVAGGRTVPYAQTPFSIVWNVPAQGCERSGRADFALPSWDIVENTPNDTFMGGNMTLFYTFGSWPALNPNDTVRNNGGIPQLGNLTLHLDLVRADVAAAIADPDFSGLAVIDMEAWRPLYSLNWDSLSGYQRASEALVKQQHPTWTNATQIKAEAETQFNTAAQTWFLQSLAAARSVRPKGIWGYYQFPYCGVPGPDGVSCPPQTIAWNDELQWLWNSVDAVFPEIYQNQASETLPLNNWTRVVGARVSEGLRVMTARPAPLHRGLVLPYGHFFTANEDKTGEETLPRAYLDVQIKTVASTGAAGVVLWGSSKESEGCDVLGTYVKTLLGPTAKAAVEDRNMCSATTCSGHGRCRDYAPPAPDPPPTSAATASCVCMDGWTGPACNSSSVVTV